MGSEGPVRADELMYVNCNCKEEGWIGPPTPEENGEHNHRNHDDDDFLSETPKESLFDSFAPASDKFLLAPRHTKYKQESRNHVVRRLDFDSTTNDDNNQVSEEEDEEEEEELSRLFEIVYDTIMDAFFAEQAREDEEEEEEEESTTPKSAPLLSGVAETCPPPPIKSAKKQRCIDKEICRKLQF